MNYFNGKPELESVDIQPPQSSSIEESGMSDVEENRGSEVVSLSQKSNAKRAMNSTAYRIFKLLQWLIVTPMSVDVMNRRFCADPLIGKPVSNDSIWLYINTLKSLGCNIGRPSPKNNFQYEMISHPFGFSLTDAQIETLSQAKAFAQQSFTHQEMMTLDGLLKKIVAYTVCDNPQEMVEQLFARSRSYDYQELSHHVAALEESIAERQLVQLTYQSPKYGEERFQFLPVSLFYEQGVVYVRGERPEFSQPSTLRIDRVLGVSSIEDEVVRAFLLGRQSQRSVIQLHILALSPEAFTGFGLTENQGVYQEELRWIDSGALSAGESPYYEVELQVRELFYLKQRLLVCGLPFRIVGPESFREELQQTLESMLKFYQAPVVEEVTNG